MADLIRISERAAYLKVKLPVDLYRALLMRHGGVSGQALRELRLAWEKTLAGMDYWQATPPARRADPAAPTVGT